MSINDYTTLLIILLFIVPGFILDFIIRKFIPLKDSGSVAEYLRFLVFSCYHYSLYALPIYYVYLNEFHLNHPIKTVFLFLLLMFISPVIWGLLIIKAREKGYIGKIFDKLKLKPLKSVPAAWDYFFSKTLPIYATVYFKDGTTVSGAFGSSSYASSNPLERDIYLEKIYLVDDLGEWVLKQGSNGLLIKAEDIKAIEFFEGGI